MLSLSDWILRLIYPEDFPKFKCPKCRRSLYAFSRSKMNPEICVQCSIDQSFDAIGRILSSVK